MTRGGIASLVLLVCVIGELITGLSIPTLHWLTLMALFAAMNQGD
jgi:hypothetical protein